MTKIITLKLIVLLIKFVLTYYPVLAQDSQSFKDLATAKECESIMHVWDNYKVLNTNANFHANLSFIQQTDSTVSSGHGAVIKVYSVDKSRKMLGNNWRYLDRVTSQRNRVFHIVRSSDDGKEQVLLALFQQCGTDNQALIIQDQTGNDVRFNQDGEKNRILIIQSDTTGSENRAGVKQRGSGNRATIIQQSE